jgi:lipopolysaccharide transport system ATP-binding protein
VNTLKIENIGKAFRTYKSELHRFARWFGIETESAEEHWVLRHINIEIGKGEAVGIVGQNGAGKSTLLKIITGTLKPTEGSIQITGRIAAMLELGMGFNPELTGRQNVLHSAGLMGFSAEEIEYAMADIEAFAEIGEYFDEPVRIYSSGMQMRVAFAVATAFRPEILIVDEALSVGDTYFQHKSFDRIREFQNAGTTLLIVSHDRSAIQSLCTRAILLDNGLVGRDGDPEDIFDFYNALLSEKKKSNIQVMDLGEGKSRVQSGTREATFKKIVLLDSSGKQTDIVKVGEKAILEISVEINEDIESLVLGCGIKDRLGQMIFGTNTHHTDQTIYRLRAGEKYNFRISFSVNLGVGSYSVHASLVKGRDHLEKNYQWIDRALVFSVINVDKYEFVGSQWNEMKFAICKE